MKGILRVFKLVAKYGAIAIVILDTVDFAIGRLENLSSKQTEKAE